MQILSAKCQVPAPSFNYFLDILVETIRDEIAGCMEKSFDKIRMSEAAKMLSIPNLNSMKEYGEKVLTYQSSLDFIELIFVVCFCREIGH